MTDQPLPSFRYYRDPVSDGTITASSTRCAVCKEVRGFIVTSAAYGAAVPDDAEFCPWCVASGDAHTTFGASFNEVDVGADADAITDVAQRTPGFPTWQDWSWPTHCGDAGVYLGQPTGEQLRKNSEAVAALLADTAQYEWGRDEAYMREFIDGLGGSQVVYLFECPHCRKQLVRWDLD